MAGESKHSRKHGRDLQKPSHLRYNQEWRWLKHKERNINKGNDPKPVKSAKLEIVRAKAQKFVPKTRKSVLN